MNDDGRQLSLLEPDDDEDESWEAWWAKLPKIPPDGGELDREAA